MPRSLLLTQAAGALGLAAGGTAGPLLMEQITGREALAALPLGFVVVGSAMSAPLVTALMGRRARAIGLLVSYAVATLGAWLVVLTAVSGSVAGLLVGSLLLGTGNTAVMLGRYVAADSAPPHRVGSAVSAAMTSVTVGAVAGPMLIGPLGSLSRWLGWPAPTGLYLLAGAIFPVTAGITLVFNRASPGRATTSGVTAPSRPGGRFLPLVVLGSANLTMVVVMAVMPAHLYAHGWSLTAVGVLVAAHIGAMFGPSPLSGWLRDRAGSAVCALLGAAALLSAAALTAASARHCGILVSVFGLVLLGLGWNLQLIGGTTLLIERTPRAGRPRAEGFGESAMGFGAALGTLGAARPLLAVGGLPLLSGAVGLLAIIVAAPLAWEARR